MKLIITFSFLLLAVQAKPFAGSGCHPYDPSKPNPAFNYFECDMECALATEKDVLCTFDITKIPKGGSVPTKIDIEIASNNPGDLTDQYLCVSTGAVTLADLPYPNRDQCVKCIGEHNGLEFKNKCENLANLEYNDDSLFIIESYLKDKPVNDNNYRDGGIYQVPPIQSRGAKLERVEIDFIVDNVNHSFYYDFHTQFDY